MNSAPEVLRLLRGLRARLAGQLLLRRMARAGLGAAALLALIAAAARWVSPVFWSGAAIASVVGVTLLWGALGAWRRRPSLELSAAVVDGAADTRDRFVTALEFSESARGGAADPAHALALQECVAYLTRRDFRPAIPWRWPRELGWILVPILAVGLLRWDAEAQAARRAASAKTATAAVAPTVKVLEKLAADAKKRSEETKSAELKRLAEEMQRSAERLAATAKQSGEAEKSTLRELAKLEELVRQFQDQQRAQPSPEELKVLEQALRENPATEQAAAALEKGDLADAARQLDAAAKAMEEKSDEAEAQRVESALRAALERLAAGKQLAESLRKMQQPPGSGAGGQMLQKLAEALRGLPPQAAGKEGQPGKPATAQELQKLLAAIEAMKDAQGEPSDAKGGEGSMSELLARLSEQKGDGKQGEVELPNPGGQPGSEHDLGTSDSPFGERPNERLPKAGEESGLKGKQGKGEVTSQTLAGATADDSKARRQYKELYEAMAPAAENAVMQENIPLGSRFFVKRYFEAIRPKE